MVGNSVDTVVLAVDDVVRETVPVTAEVFTGMVVTGGVETVVAVQDLLGAVANSVISGGTVLVVSELL